MPKVLILKNDRVGDYFTAVDSINLILIRKILELDKKLRKIVQFISLEKGVQGPDEKMIKKQ